MGKALGLTQILVLKSDSDENTAEVGGDCEASWDDAHAEI